LDYRFEPDLARASTPPARWYFDPSQLRAERERIFARTWQLIAPAAGLQHSGDYLTSTVGGEPLIVLRQPDDAITAMSNVCRHRAGPVARGRGNAKAFRCGYHGWTWATDGTLISAPEFERVECFDRDLTRLPQFRVETWLGQMFVNLDSAAPPLREVLGNLAARVEESRYAGFRPVARKEWTIACNWKVYVDNYLEGYHIPIVHPGLFREIDYERYRTETARFFSIQHSPLRKPKRIRTNDPSDEAQFFWLFPNLMLNVYPDNFSTNLIVPLDERRTLTIFEWFFRDQPGKALADTVSFSDEIQIEDIEICEAVQRGLESRTYDTGRYSVERENGVHHFHGLLAEFLGDQAVSR
jgi:choline monooxygenase